MKRHRFIGPFDLTQDHLRLFESAARQIALVLKLKAGEEILLGDGKGNEALAILSSIDKKEVTADVLERWKNENEPARRVTLYCAILKRENFEFVVQKATEVGVTEIVPIITRRTIKTGIKLERLRQIAQEAAELSGRGIVPTVQEPMKFEEALVDAKRHGISFFLDVTPAEAGDQPGLDSRLRGNDGSVGLFVGPEGGWDEVEVAMAKKAKFISVSLGPLTFRAETAAVVGSFLASR